MLTCFAHPTCWAGFGEPDTAFWCCYGTGVESFAKLNDNVYFEAAVPAPPIQARVQTVRSRSITAKRGSSQLWRQR